MHALCAVIYGNKEVDIQRIKDCKKIIKEQTSIFSAFRANTFLALAAMLSLEEDPVGRMEDIRDTYSVFKENKFWGSDFLALSSFLIKGVGHEGKKRLVQKAQRNAYRHCHEYIDRDRDCPRCRNCRILREQLIAYMPAPPCVAGEFLPLLSPVAICR